MLVLEELAVDACESPDTLDPLTERAGELVVELLARLHATFWERVPDWATRVGRFACSRPVSCEAVVASGIDRSARCTRRAGTLHRRERPRGRANDRRAAGHRLHGDAYPETSTSETGEVGLLDWQASPPWRSRPRAGLHARDEHGPQPTGNTPARAAGPYRRALRASGGRELDRDQLWDRYARRVIRRRRVTDHRRHGRHAGQTTRAGGPEERGVAALEDLTRRLS